MKQVDSNKKVLKLVKKMCKQLKSIRLIVFCFFAVDSNVLDKMDTMPSHLGVLGIVWKEYVWKIFLKKL